MKSSWLDTTVVGQAVRYCTHRAPQVSPKSEDICVETPNDKSRHVNGCSSVVTCTNPVVRSQKPIVVDWDGPDDKENPQNWPTLYKAWITLLISVYSFVVYCGSSIIVPSYQGMMLQFGISDKVASLVLALYVVGYGTGPLIFSPLSEVASIGRNPPYVVSFILFVIISIVLATLNNFPAIVVLRFLQGFFGSPCLATGGATVQDITRSWDTIPYLFAAWVSCIYCAPALGPLFASHIVQTRSWHWSLWEIAMMSGPLCIILICLLPETSADTILLRRARHRRLHRHGHPENNPRINHHPTILAPSELNPIPFSSILRDSLAHPLEIPLKDPAILFTDLYISFIYAIYYSFFEAFHRVYQDLYHMSLVSCSLIFLSIVIGVAVSVVLYILYLVNRSTVQDVLIANNNFEACLVPAIPGVCFAPIGLFLFAWTARASIHWVVPTVGIAIYIAATFVILQAFMLYLPLSYPRYVASLFAANDFSRSASAAVLIMVAPYMYDRMGISKGVTLLASISTLGIVGMLLIWWFGANLRARSRFAG
ncbi:hypothetical protein EYZ11_006816 [Aspergillus tanneri]|uniref:Major facilitator superfamily (MFS) profile domain-containing protein n=1 Tax=Aspergillus tanneri TaxID=1220188 RepID=A0A4S3JF07_9EURO|nr:uncharacterized protein ATNIH1004_011338 [Aspergillus tanneri]KAA8642394.1 hypothetical protein ATNIH1004_011338 [Aspergillus tanneri]THC93705.1 hypothetical protein EYZ11_006816 [Aspergillus tanneri]